MPQDKTRRGIFSVRVKLLGIYMLVVLAILIVILVVFPRVFERYMMERSQTDLLTTRQIIQETLEETDFQTNLYLRDRLDAVARAKGIEIWICKEKVQSPSGISIPTLRLGGSTDSQDIVLSSTNAALIENIRSGVAQESLYQDLFPDYFSQKTITMAYSTPYYEQTTLGEVISMRKQSTAVVLLNIAVSDISDSVQTTLHTILIVFVVLSILIAATIALVSNHMIDSIHQMQEVASAVTHGDFSKKVEVLTNDELGELADTFNLMVDELQEVDETQRAFISNISHDFRSPLTSIRGFVQAMLEDVIPPDQHKKYLQVVFDETNRLSKLANDLLLLNKMQSGTEELQITRFDINEMIVSLTLSFEQRIEEKHLQMQFHFLQDKLFVSADMDKIQRVIYNLVDNAIKFTRPGDTITIETSIVNKKAFIAVSDTGIGMDEESLRHIFERFHKGDKSRGINKSGMGLGLAIVKQIIVNHGEEIHVSSKEGKGTTFDFTLPLANQVSFVEKK